jgi:hypothetical protein
MNEDLRDSIEHLRKHYIPTPEMDLVLQTAEQVLSAGEELPEKIDVPKICNFNDCDLYSNHEDCGGGCFEFNKAHSLFLPILAKKNLRIRELEEENKQLKRHIGNLLQEEDL